MPSPPPSGSTSIATPAAPGATPAVSASGLATADFLNLLAGMIETTPPAATPAPAAPVIPQRPADARQASGSAQTAALAELPGLLELLGLPEMAVGSEGEPSQDLADDDEPELSADDDSGEKGNALALLALPLLPALPATASAPANGAATSTAAATDSEIPTLELTSGSPAPLPAQASSREAIAAPVSLETPASAQQPAAVPIGVAANTTAAADELPETTTATSPTNSNTGSHVSHLQTLASAHAMQEADSAQPREMRAPVGTPAWTQELGDRLNWMAQHGREAASLRLSPEHLGPLEVRISMREGEASVWFGAAHADTRAALEQSLPRLRELFASQGMVLADAGVFRDAPRGQPQASPSSNANHRDATGAAEPVTRATVRSVRLLDTYA